MSYNFKNSDSWFWRSIMACVPKFMKNVQIILLRGGKSHFWNYRWLTSKPLSIRRSDISYKNIRIKDCWVDNSWNVELLKDLVGEEAMKESSNQNQ